jgi:hypothetical protein
MALIAPSAGCGDEAQETSPLESTYSVLRHTQNNTGCDEEGNPVDQSDRFFRLADTGGSLDYHKCAAADACESAVNVTKGFTEKAGGVWRKIDIQTDEIRLNTGDFGCSVTLTERTAELEGSDLTIEQRTFEGEVEREGDQECTDAHALANRDALECAAYEVVVAVSVD